MTKSALSKLFTLALLVSVSVGCVPQRGASFAPTSTYQVEPAAATPKVETLSNGVRLVVTSFTGTSQAAVEVLYGVGSAHDVIPGTAHFLEHLMFRGTARRPHQIDVASDIESLGCTFNANTSDDNTAYHIKTSADNIVAAIDILHDMLSSSQLRQEDIDMERPVVAQENLGYLESPDRAANENLDLLMVPASRSSADDVAALPRLNRPELAAFRAAYYTTDNVVVSIAGNVDFALMRQAVVATFGSDRATRHQPVKTVKASALPGQHLRVVTSATATRVHLNVGLSSLGLSPAHHAAAATTLLADILGGDMAGRLFQAIRTQRGLTYGINARYYSGSNQFQINTAANADRLAETLTVVVSELKRLRDDGMTPRELARGKIGAAAEDLRPYETPYGVAHDRGYSYLTSNVLRVPGSWGQALRSVTPMEAAMAARALLRTSRLYVSVVVPPGTVVPYEAIMSQLGE